MLKVLSPEEIAAIKATSRQRGLYKAELAKFLEGGEAGVQVDLENGDFESKAPNTVMQGFRNAITDETPVRVILNEDSVYLLRTDG